MFCGIIKVVRNEVLSMSMTRRGTDKDLGFIIGTMEEFVTQRFLIYNLKPFYYNVNRKINPLIPVNTKAAGL